MYYVLVQVEVGYAESSIYHKLLNESAKYIRGYHNTYIKVYVRRLSTGGVRGVNPKLHPVSRDSGK